MERREFIALLGAAGGMLPQSAQAQSVSVRGGGAEAAKLTGAWTFASSVNTRRDGTHFDRWGENPKGIFLFDASGSYAQIIVGSESRVFGAKTFCSFGTYSVDATNKVLATRIEGCSVGRLNGTVQKRDILLLTASELKYSNPTTVSGTTAEVLWKRMT